MLHFSFGLFDFILAVLFLSYFFFLTHVAQGEYEDALIVLDEMISVETFIERYEVYKLYGLIYHQQVYLSLSLSSLISPPSSLLRLLSSLSLPSLFPLLSLLFLFSSSQ